MLIFGTLFLLALSFDRTWQQIVEDEQNSKTLILNDPFDDYEWLAQFREEYGNHCEAAKNALGDGRCYYMLDPKLLMPAKIELLSFDPLVIMFHSVLSDIYIHEILNITHNQLENGIKQDFSRVAEHAQLDDNNTVDPYIIHLYTKLTGISFYNAELMNVINYNPGGHNAPHYDFLDAETLWQEREGDRIATILTFLHEPKNGGHTVFPNLDLSIQPTKGSMLLWFNVLPIGEADMRVLHAGCPVWEGIKIIGTIWVRRRGNELAIKCLDKSSFQPNSFQHGLIRFIK